MYLVPGVEDCRISGSAVRLQLFSGPEVQIALGNESGEALLNDEVLTLYELVPWWPRLPIVTPPWSLTSVSMRGADHPVLVRVNVWRSWARHLTRWFRPRPKPEHFPTLHKEHGWTDYQGGVLEDEFKRYPMRRYYKWLR